MVTFAVVVLTAVVVAGVAFWMMKRRDSVFDVLIAKRKTTSRISSKAELVDGRNHIPVALTLDPAQIYYENTDLEAALDIDRIDEVEYGSELVTGETARGSVLRLRAHGRAVEFVLNPIAARQWSELLPARRMGD
ncbi:MAG: hypothetical protein WA208_19770 [Thermoanaerobaculia bacterium]